MALKAVRRVKGRKTTALEYVNQLRTLLEESAAAIVANDYDKWYDTVGEFAILATTLLVLSQEVTTIVANIA